MKNILSCNCRTKHECPLDGKRRVESIVYKCTASVDGYPNKVYLGTVEGDFKQRFYNYQMSFNKEGHSTDTTLPKYVLELKEKFKIRPSIKTVHNQIRTSLFKHFQEMSVVPARKI